MKILLDECLPRKLKHDLAGHDVMTVPEAGWASIRDAPLLRLAETRFEVFVTGDQNLQYQQNLHGTSLAIIVLGGRNNLLETLRPLMPEVVTALQTILPGDIVQIGAVKPRER
jgi:predicted nuclease of predicted toxin-antitoxin system